MAKDSRMEERADELFREAYLIATGGFDSEIASEAMSSAVEALKIQADFLKQESQKLLDGTMKLEPDKAARMLSYTAKVIDEITRLISFSKGKPDSRPDLGNGWMAGLTEKQLSQVQEWIEENKAIHGRT